MEKERRTGIGWIVLALGVVGLVGLVGLAPSAAAEIGQASTEAEPGHCVTIDETGPGVRVDPPSCRKAIENLVTDPPPSAITAP